MSEHQPPQSDPQTAPSPVPELPRIIHHAKIPTAEELEGYKAEHRARVERMAENDPRPKGGRARRRHR